MSSRGEVSQINMLSAYTLELVQMPCFLNSVTEPKTSIYKSSYMRVLNSENLSLKKHQKSSKMDFQNSIRTLVIYSCTRILTPLYAYQNHVYYHKYQAGTLGSCSSLKTATDNVFFENRPMVGYNSSAVKCQLSWRCVPKNISSIRNWGISSGTSTCICPPMSH